MEAGNAFVFIHTDKLAYVYGCVVYANPTVCLQCDTGFYLYGKKCYQQCPAIVFGNLCLNVCPQGMFFDPIAGACLCKI